MDVWIRSRADWSHRARLPALSFDVPIFSAKNDAGSVTVPGAFDDLRGCWAVLDGRLYLVSSCSSKNGSTTLKLQLPENAFTRKLWYTGSGSEVYGAFLANRLAVEYIQQADSFYAMPYLSVSNSDTTGFVMPVATGDSFTLRDIMVQAAEAGVYCTWTPSQAGVSVSIAPRQPSELNLFDGDGHTQVTSWTYSLSIVAKCTARHIAFNRTTGAIVVMDSTDYYWHPDGTVSTTPPVPRLPGDWTQVNVNWGDPLLDAAQAEFESNAEACKLEFYSDKDLQLDDIVVCRYSDLLVRASVTYAGVSSKDRRTLYRAGRADTTLTEKVGGSSGGRSSSSGGSAGSNHYPVGSIYLSVNSTDPASLFGGRWERIQDVFLLCAGSSYAAGTAGGAATVTLTEEQIPSHRHNLPRKDTSGSSSGYSLERVGGSSVKMSWGSPYTGYTGGGQPHTNMPPYLAVYAWKRVA